MQQLSILLYFHRTLIIYNYCLYFDSYRRWSDSNSWVNTTLGRAPIEGEDVVINSSWRMLLDVNPPPLGRVFVYGELKFEDERDYNFTAALVSLLIQTYQLQATVYKMIICVNTFNGKDKK